MTTAEMDRKVQEIRELQTTIEELTADLEAAKDVIKAQMIDQGREEITGNGWKATWHTVTSSRFDSKALKEAAPEIFARFSKQTTVCRFCIS